MTLFTLSFTNYKNIMYSYQSHIPAHIGNLKKKIIKKKDII